MWNTAGGYKNLPAVFDNLYKYLV